MFLFPNAIRGLSCKFTKFQMPANFPAKNLNSGTIVHCLNKRLVDLSRRESDELMSIWKRYSSVLNVEHWNQSRARQTVGMKFIQRIKRKLVEQRLKHLVNYFMICTNRHDLQFKIPKNAIEYSWWRIFTQALVPPQWYLMRLFLNSAKTFR